jgi:hypothetical protein
MGNFQKQVVYKAKPVGAGTAVTPIGVKLTNAVANAVVKSANGKSIIVTPKELAPKKSVKVTKALEVIDPAKKEARLKVRAEKQLINKTKLANRRLDSMQNMGLRFSKFYNLEEFKECKADLKIIVDAIGKVVKASNIKWDLKRI